jgi:hypothetical protein
MTQWLFRSKITKCEKRVIFGSPYSLNDKAAELGDPTEVELQTVIKAKRQEAREALERADSKKLVETHLELRRLETLKEAGSMAKFITLREFAADGRGESPSNKGRASRSSTSGSTHSGGISGAKDGRAQSLNKSSYRKSSTTTHGTTHSGGPDRDPRDPGMNKSTKRGAGGRETDPAPGPKTGTFGDDASTLSPGHIKPGAQDKTKAMGTRPGRVEDLIATVTAILMGQNPDSANVEESENVFDYKTILGMVKNVDNPALKKRLAKFAPENANAKFKDLATALEAVGARYYEDDEVRQAISNGKIDPDWVNADEGEE